MRTLDTVDGKASSIHDNVFTCAVRVYRPPKAQGGSTASPPPRRQPRPTLLLPRPPNSVCETDNPIMGTRKRAHFVEKKKERALQQVEFCEGYCVVTKRRRKKGIQNIHFFQRDLNSCVPLRASLTLTHPIIAHVTILNWTELKHSIRFGEKSCALNQTCRLTVKSWPVKATRKLNTLVLVLDLVNKIICQAV